MTFNSYLANSIGVLVSFSPSLGGGPVSAGYEADLLYSLTPITEGAGSGSLNPGWKTSGSGAPSENNLVTPFGTTPTTQGYFQGANNFVMNPYTPGTTVYFEVIAYQIAAGNYYAAVNRGHSASFSTTLATGLEFPTDIYIAGFRPFEVMPSVPEPTTLALVGVGGVASLIAWPRRQS